MNGLSSEVELSESDLLLDGDIADDTLRELLSMDCRLMVMSVSGLAYCRLFRYRQC